MVGYICVGMLAAFGLLSISWCLFGWLLPGDRGGRLVYDGDSGFLHRYLWLRGLGLMKCSLTVVDPGFSEAEKLRLEDRGIEICTREAAASRLGIGAE